MSGRDLRSFVTSHRSEGSDKLVKRMTDGLYGNHYKEVNYDQLRAVAAERKLKGHVALIKVKKLQHLSKQGKAQNLIKQHKLVWHKEFLRLNTQRKKFQAEIDTLIRQNTEAETYSHIFQEIEDFDTSLGSTFLDFKRATSDPIWALRDDLQYWLFEHSSEVKAGGLEKEHSRVLETVKNVKAQQDDILSKLHNEQKMLEQELLLGDLSEYCRNTEKNISHGIPLEAFELECPDMDMKSSVLQEFIMLDDKYMEKLDELEDSHASALSTKTGTWNEDEHFLFQTILEQYTYDIKSRWTLIIDRLKRQFPDKARAEFIAHDEWYTNYIYYHSRRKALLHDWQRDRGELLNKTKALFAEMCIAHELATTKRERQQKQHEICQMLCEKVKEWREYKLEMMNIQSEMEEGKREEYIEKQKRREEKEHERRVVEKKQISEYLEKVAAKRKSEEEKNKKRLEDIQQILAEQAVYDKERVAYRYEMQQEILRNKEKLKEEAAQKNKEKEERLEALRQKVRPNIETDPARVISETQSWKERLKSEEEPEVYLKRPLFQVNSYTNAQITADPRIRVEQELRKAGLLESKYAREVMSQVKPLQVPRPDLQSNLFK